MRKILTGLALILAVLVSLPAVAFAHVVVSPAQAEVGSRTTFTISVPNEKQVAVTGLRLTIPAGLENVTPTVHAGWTIATTKDGETTTEIRWDQGSIPMGMRDEFSFRAMVPGKETDLIWKAYQTYADGTTVAWDQDPNPEHTDGEDSTSGPYSVTKVVTEVVENGSSTASTSSATSRAVNWAFAICLVSLALSVAAFVRYRKK